MNVATIGLFQPLGSRETSRLGRLGDHPTSNSGRRHAVCLPFPRMSPPNGRLSTAALERRSAEHQRAPETHRAHRRTTRPRRWAGRRTRGTALELAASMHDIGKLALPHRVLSKPGAARPPRAQDRADPHRDRGTVALWAQAGAWVRLARSIALHHHERWDGRGYPRRLAGTSIPARGPHRRRRRRLRRAHASSPSTARRSPPVARSSTCACSGAVTSTPR